MGELVSIMKATAQQGDVGQTVPNQSQHDRKIENHLGRVMHRVRPSPLRQRPRQRRIQPNPANRRGQQRPAPPA
jgi:hypothetical protein